MVGAAPATRDVGDGAVGADRGAVPPPPPHAATNDASTAAATAATTRRRGWDMAGETTAGKRALRCR